MHITPTHNPTHRDDDDMDALAQELCHWSNQYIPLSHIHWALWGLIQAKQSSVDFDFEAYAVQRMQAFFKSADEVFGDV